MHVKHVFLEVAERIFLVVLLILGQAVNVNLLHIVGREPASCTVRIKPSVSQRDAIPAWPL